MSQSGSPAYFTFSATAVAGGRIVVPSPSGYLYPFDAHGVVYVGSGDGSLYAFALKHGKKLLSAKLGDKAITSSPTVVNGAVYVGSDDGDVVAFRLRR